MPGIKTALNKKSFNSVKYNDNTQIEIVRNILATYILSKKTIKRYLLLLLMS